MTFMTFIADNFYNILHTMLLFAILCIVIELKMSKK